MATPLYVPIYGSHYCHKIGRTLEGYIMDPCFLVRANDTIPGVEWFLGKEQPQPNS